MSHCKYEEHPIIVYREGARFDTCVRLSGGFNLNIENLSLAWLPSLAPISVDFKRRLATPIKNVLVHSEYIPSTSGNFMYVDSRSIMFEGMYIGNGKEGSRIVKIERDGALYKITLSKPFKSKIPSGAVLFEATEENGATQKNKANALNYASTEVNEDATVTGIASIYEIKRTQLGAPISDQDILDLGDRFLFLY